MSIINNKIPQQKNEHAVALSKLGASKGGKMRAMKLSAYRRAEIAKNAAAIRWNKRPSGYTDEEVFACIPDDIGELG